MFSQKTYFVDVCLDPYYASAVEIFTINWGTLVIVDLEIFRKITVKHQFQTPFYNKLDRRPVNFSGISKNTYLVKHLQK